MKNALKLISVPLMALALTACSNYDDRPPGHYEHTSSSVDKSGTAHQNSTSTDVGYDSNGDKTATTKTQHTDDPPGLFNKKTSTTTDTETESGQ